MALKDAWKDAQELIFTSMISKYTTADFRCYFLNTHVPILAFLLTPIAYFLVSFRLFLYRSFY